MGNVLVAINKILFKISNTIGISPSGLRCLIIVKTDKPIKLKKQAPISEITATIECSIIFKRNFLKN